MFLYVRMMVLILVNLFVARVILDALGEVDYGIYNVVGGVVAMFSVISNSLSTAISRFLTFELGCGDMDKLKRLFSTSISILILMALLVGIIVEIVGVWFLNSKMNIPTDRLVAANWVLHFSVLSFIVTMMSGPYNAIIISHERMSVFAYISILDAVLRLGVAYLIYTAVFDQLILYAFLLMLVTFIIRVVYGVYCKQNFEEATYHFIFDRKLFKEVASFASWNMFGQVAYMLNTQGVNILINIFFGVVLNATRGIAVQVDNVLNQFVNNFTVALNPQITKSYAVGNLEYCYQLICSGTKYCYYIMYFFTVPLVLEADTVLRIWLKEVPEYTTLFLRLVMFSSLVSLMGIPMLTGIQATGKIRRYQINVTIIGCLVFPFSWIAYKLGAPAYVTYIIFIVIYFLLNFIRLFTLKYLMNFPVTMFFKKVGIQLVFVSSLAFVAPALVCYYMEPSFWRFVLVTIVSLLWTSITIYLVGLEKQERVFVTNKVSEMFRKIK